jgi:hypothetical protein
MPQRPRHPINIPNTPDFGINDNATPDEQAAAFSNPGFNTGINEHGYTGNQREGAGRGEVGPAIVRNEGKYVVAPAQVNSGSQVQPIRLQGGGNTVITREGGVISGGNELVVGGMGLSPNLLLNLPSADGMHRGMPVWNYSAMERIDALPIYQANRARYLDRLADIVESDEYDFFIIAIPANMADATIQWKQTYRDQCSVPPESLLVMILADTIPAQPE